MIASITVCEYSSSKMLTTDSKRQHQFPNNFALPNLFNSLLSFLKRQHRIDNIIKLNPRRSQSGAKIVQIHLRARVDPPMRCRKSVDHSTRSHKAPIATQN